MAKKNTMIVKDDELSRIIAKYCGISIAAIKEIRKAECEVIEGLLKQGYSVKWGTIGKFSLRDVKPRKGRMMYVPVKEEWVQQKDTIPHQKPKFEFYPKIRSDIEELTKGKLL